MRNIENENIYFVTGYLLGYHIGARQDEMECEDRASFKEGYDAGCADATDDED
jgi:hypothetical protein